MPRKDNFPKARARSGSTLKSRAQRVGSLHLYTHPKLGRKKISRGKRIEDHFGSFCNFGSCSESR